MFKRDILFHLERWKVDTHRKPLILRGARQVGKTTVVNEFGKQFDNYLYLNLEKREAASLFELNVSSFRLFPVRFSIKTGTGLDPFFRFYLAVSVQVGT